MKSNEILMRFTNDQTQQGIKIKFYLEVCKLLWVKKMDRKE